MMDRKLIKLVLFVSTFYLLSSLFSRPVFAGWRCEPQYGGGEKCWGTGEISVNKLVREPESESFIDNVTFNALKKYLPNDLVLFRLEITNHGQGEFSKVTVKDKLPTELNFEWGPVGWNSSTRELNFEIYNLKVGEKRGIDFMTRVVSSENLPNQEITCFTNYVWVWAEDKSDDDQAQVCIQKKVSIVATLPPTGIENLWLLAIGFISLAGVGAKLALAKKS